MKKTFVLAAVATLVGQFNASAFAAGMFDQNTMLGYKQRQGAAAMAYFHMPFNTVKNYQFQPRAGLMITTPSAYYPGKYTTRTSRPGVLDFSLTGGRHFQGPFTATLKVNNNVTWISNPDALPKNTGHSLEGGLSQSLMRGLGVDALSQD